MPIKILTVKLDPATGVFDDASVREETTGAKVLNVDHVELFAHRGEPSLALVISCDDPPDTSHRRRREAIDWRERLAGADVPLYEQLADWRNRVAASEGCPRFMVLSNRTLAGVAALRPRDEAELLEVPGIGEAKSSRYGAEILELVGTVSEELEPPAA